MHITSHPTASIHLDNEDSSVFNVVAFNKLITSHHNPFNAVRAAIRVEELKPLFLSTIKQKKD